MTFKEQTIDAVYTLIGRYTMNHRGILASNMNKLQMWKGVLYFFNHLPEEMFKLDHFKCYPDLYEILNRKIDCK